MIVVDTSALVAIAKGEREGWSCVTALSTDEPVWMSAGTLTEFRIVTIRGEIEHTGRRLLDRVAPKIAPLTPERAEAAAQAYARWGKGVHPARLNFGDCFAYALAEELACPLLYIGNDFAQTDIVSAIAER